MLVAGAALLGILVLLFALTRITGRPLSPAGLRVALEPLGIAAPFGLALALALVLVVPVIPASLFQIAAGTLLGPWAGLLWTVIADWLGASIGFWLGRLWGKPLLNRVLAPHEQASLQRLAERMDWRIVVLLRLVPGPAYPLVSIAAGYASLSYPEFIIASLAGVMPALVLLVLAGDLVEKSPIVSVLIVIAVLLSVVVAGRFVKMKGKSEGS